MGGFAGMDPVLVFLRDDLGFDLDVAAAPCLDAEIVVVTPGG